jgi:tetratricopeptide (TPR) repeat protein
MAAKVNPLKVKQEAEAFEKAGRVDQAIAKYREIVADNPRDWNVINKIGDLLAKLNRIREATDEYAKVADFYAKDGFLLKAIAIWRKVNKLDTSAVEPYLHLADLYAKQGLLMEAKSQYQIVVDEHLKRGKTREAGDVLKKMADIDPGDLKIRSKLADLYTRGGDAAQAVDEHVAIADELSKKGHLAEAIQVLEKGLKLDPRSYRLRAEVARVHLVQKSYDRAIQHLEEAVRLHPGDPAVLSSLGEAYLGARKLEEAEAIFKRLIELDPEDDDSRVQMARLFLSQDAFDRAFAQLEPVVKRAVEAREGEKAVSLLQQVAQRNPQHVPTLEKLVEVYQLLHRDNALSAAFSQLTEAYIGDSQFDRAAAVLEELVEREPYNQQHRTKLEFVRSRLGGAPVAARSSPRSAPTINLGDVLEEEFDLTPDEEIPAPAPAPAPRASAPPAAPPTPIAPARPAARVEITGPLSAEDREFIEEHLAEGRVFRKYGLTDKAIDQFEAVVARFPDNLEARLELRDLYGEKGATARSAEQSLALAEIHRLRGDEGAAREHEERGRAVAGPEAAAPPSPARPAAPAAPRPVEDEEISIEVEEAGFEVVAAEPVTSPIAEADNEFRLEDDSAEELPVRFLDEEEGAPPEDIPFSVEPEAPDLLVEPEPPPPPPRAEAPRAPRPAPPAPPRPAPPPPAPVPAAVPGLPADLRRSLEEVEQYVSLGFVDDARDALREISARYPGHPALLARVEELGLGMPEGEPEPAVREAEIDVGDSLLGMPEQEGVESLPPPVTVGDEADPFADLGLEEPPDVPEPAPDEEPAVFSVREEEDIEVSVTAVDEPAATGDADLDIDIGVVEEEEEQAPPPRAARTFEVPTAVDEPSLDFDLEAGLGGPASAPAGEGLELADELGELFGAQQAVAEPPAAEAVTTFEDSGLADIFKEFKKGVDKQLGKEDYDTRYNLGIAYKEMGLIDEAIAEFQLAARDENRLLECSSMLGICFMDKGMPKLAVKWFEKGLAVPGRSDEEYQGLRYDLATAYAAAGEDDRALTIFTDLYGQNANFRDVATKVRELSAGRP